MIFQDQPDLYISIGIKLVFLITLSSLILIVQRLLQVIIGKRVAQSNKISLDMINGLKLIIRLGSLGTIFYLTLFLFEYSIEFIFGFSAIIGAIISFGSVQWMSNFIAGVYLLLLRPFNINDFVKLNEEILGTVENISLNYTKIKTINGNYHHIPNKIIARSNIVIYYGKRQRIIGAKELEKPSKEQPIIIFRQLARYLIEERIIRYTFLWGTPLGDLQITKRKLLEVCEIYAGIFGYKPEFYLESLGHRMNFRFIIATLNAKILAENFYDFRNALIEAFH